MPVGEEHLAAGGERLGAELARGFPRVGVAVDLDVGERRAEHRLELGPQVGGHAFWCSLHPTFGDRPPADGHWVVVGHRLLTGRLDAEDGSDGRRIGEALDRRPGPDEWPGRQRTSRDGRVTSLRSGVARRDIDRGDRARDAGGDHPGPGRRRPGRGGDIVRESSDAGRDRQRRRRHAVGG